MAGCGEEEWEERGGAPGGVWGVRGGGSGGVELTVSLCKVAERQ